MQCRELVLSAVLALVLVLSAEGTVQSQSRSLLLSAGAVVWWCSSPGALCRSVLVLSAVLALVQVSAVPVPVLTTVGECRPRSAGTVQSQSQGSAVGVLALSAVLVPVPVQSQLLSADPVVQFQCR